MKKSNHKSVSAYFTVEAALVMPIVLVCYFVIMLFLCYVYERGILEQNACRLPVWLEYVEGYTSLYPGEADAFTSEEICRYVQGCLNQEEEQRYLLGTDIRAALSLRGDSVGVERSFVYSPFGEWKQEFSVTAFCPDPVEYIRTANLISKTITEKEEESDDKK